MRRRAQLGRGIAPDGVLHLAAQSFVPRSFEQPRETFEINMLGTLNLLQALRAGGFADDSSGEFGRYIRPGAPRRNYQ